jgi:hypothetical protein
VRPTASGITRATCAWKKHTYIWGIRLGALRISARLVCFRLALQPPEEQDIGCGVGQRKGGCGTQLRIKNYELRKNKKIKHNEKQQQ